MNTNIWSIIGLGKSGLIAIAITIGAITNSSAQNNPPVQTPNINGLFTPTAAQRFFETGRNNFEKEIDSVIDSEDSFSKDLLQLNPELVEQMKETSSTQDTEQSNRQLKF